MHVFSIWTPVCRYRCLYHPENRGKYIIFCSRPSWLMELFNKLRSNSYHLHCRIQNVRRTIRKPRTEQQHGQASDRKDRVETVVNHVHKCWSPRARWHMAQLGFVEIEIAKQQPTLSYLFFLSLFFCHLYLCIVSDFQCSKYPHPGIILGLSGLGLPQSNRFRKNSPNQCSALSGLLGSNPSRGGTRKYI